MRKMCLDKMSLDKMAQGSNFGMAVLEPMSMVVFMVHSHVSFYIFPGNSPL